jgi:hypothetical protein
MDVDGPLFPLRRRKRGLWYRLSPALPACRARARSSAWRSVMWAWEIPHPSWPSPKGGMARAGLSYPPFPLTALPARLDLRRGRVLHWQACCARARGHVWRWEPCSRARWGFLQESLLPLGRMRFGHPVERRVMVLCPGNSTEPFLCQRSVGQCGLYWGVGLRRCRHRDFHWCRVCSRGYITAWRIGVDCYYWQHRRER